MLFSLLACLLLFAGVSFGLAWPVAASLALRPAEKILASIALSLVGVFCVAWSVYVFAFSTAAFWALPALAAVGLIARRRQLGPAWNDPAVRAAVVAQALVTAWAVGWLATVATYSGGGWAGDWFEHWERARFFLAHEPLETKFLGQYAVTARPPLANVVTGFFLTLTRLDFAHYQLISTLFASIVFLPAALLALRWGPLRSIAILAVLVMVNPLFVQNATFAWTKLPAAFFVLTALYFFLRAHDPDPPASAALLCGASLAAGLLTHYSAAPYAVVLALSWIAQGWSRRTDPKWWRRTAQVAAAGALLLALWLGWALAVFGGSGTFLTNSSVTSADAHQGNQFVKITLNLFDTLVPHFLRPLDPALIAQRSPWGALHDWFFQCYQVNLPLALGSIAWAAIARELVRLRRTATAPERAFWAWYILGVLVLGTATHGQRDHWGLAHICLPALVITGLCFLAARWTTLGRGWRVALTLGAAFDLVCGILLHFGVQSFLLDRWFLPGRWTEELLASISSTAQMNLLAKITHRVAFFADVIGVPLAAVVAVLALLFGVAVRQARANS